MTNETRATLVIYQWNASKPANRRSRNFPHDLRDAIAETLDEAEARGKKVNRADRCAACGKPTYVGEDFAGPCVHSTDLACATFERDYARRETATLRERMIAEANDHERWGNHLVASTLRRLANP